MNVPDSPDREAGEREWHRLMGRALRESPADALPADFAACTAARVAAMEDGVVGESGFAGDRFERWLQRALLAVLCVAGAAAALILGGEGGKAVAWMTAAALCLAAEAAVQNVISNESVARARSGSSDTHRSNP